MARPTPEALRNAADEVAAANTAETARREAEEAAQQKKAEALAANSKADEALAAAGYATGNGGNTSRWDRIRTSCGCESRAGGILLGVAIATAVIALLLVLMSLNWGFSLANSKASESRVEAVSAVAVSGSNTAAETKGKVDVTVGNLSQTTDVATSALAKAEKADANAHNADANARLALKHGQHHTSAPRGPHTTKVVKAPVAQASANATAVAVATPQVLATTGTNEVCRLRSNGTARLLSAPKAVLGKDYVIATDKQDPASPQASVIARTANESCDTWRTRVDAQLVDHKSN